MNPIVRNILAVFAGIITGSIVNMGLVILGGNVIPPPDGVDVSNSESLKASMHLFEFRHFIFPFLAHALGTLAGALIAGVTAANNKMWFAMGIGIFFLVGGIANIWMIGGPIWFTVLDLLLAYLPMGWIAGRIVSKRK